MSANQDNSTQAPSGPVLCKMGCGFFGSNATGDCCSKCFMDAMKKKADKCQPVSSVTAAPTPVASPLPTPVEKEVPVEQEPEPEAMEVDTPAPKPVKKKKKKKQSYKSMMKAMTTSDCGRDVQQEQREKIVTGVGGGAFTKIEKI